ncbi:unnamed protein product [Paramecium pentaurelia]|uniref:WD40-repeat-containing domain n=1 Tax=Paramecium pentaurelia TaxID=43138 RepID=A0A8S1WGI7_9CILI|nr:unnamed protein product [Paramecium pentaurelia]
MQKGNHKLEKNKCSEHNEKAVFIRTSFTNNKHLKLCYKCILNQNKNLMLIEDVEQQFQNAKIQIIKEIKSKRERNSIIFKNIKENLLKFQTSTQDKISQIMLNIDEHLKQIANTNYETLENLTVFNFDEIEKLLISNTINFEKIKNMLSNNFQSLSTSYFIKVNEQYLAKIELEEENYKFRLNQELTNCKIQNTIKLPNNNLICEKHQSQLMMVDLSEQSNLPNRIACYYCITEYTAKYTSFEEFQQVWMKNKSRLYEQFITYQKQVNSQIENSIELISVFKEKMIKFLDVHQTALIQIKNIPNLESVYIVQQLISKEWIDLNEQEIIEIAKTLSQLNKGQMVSKEIKEEFDQKLWKFKESSNHLISQFQLMQNQFILDIKNLQKTEEELKVSNCGIKEDLSQNTNMNSNKKPINYDFIEQDPMLDLNINSIQFSPDSLILIAGCSDGKIQVFELKSEKLKLLEVLHEHKNQVDSLLFMKKSKEFLSGSKDETMVIWSGTKQYKDWRINQKLRGNNGMLNCMALNNDENYFAAGCGKTLKLWSKDKEWKFQYTILEDKTDISSICFSDSQNILVSSSYNSKCISIFQLSKANTWARSQTIMTNQWGSNLIFLDSTSFIFQPFNQDILQIHDFHPQLQQYEKSKQIRIDFGNQNNYSPSTQIIKSQDFLLYRAGQNLNLIRCFKNKQFNIEWSLKLRDGRQICTISDNSKYIATWNQDTKEFLIRKQKD